MDWLSQNWIWVALAIGVAFFFLRGGHGGGFGRSGHGGHGGGLGGLGGGHGGHGGGLGGLLGGLGHGGHGGGSGHGGGHGGGSGHGGHGEQAENRAASNAPEAAVDPVSGEAVRTAQALTSLYHGKIYYFATKENRDRFEAAPQEYAGKAAGHPAHAAEAPRERPRRRGGC